MSVKAQGLFSLYSWSCASTVITYNFTFHFYFTTFYGQILHFFLLFTLEMKIFQTKHMLSHYSYFTNTSENLLTTDSGSVWWVIWLKYYEKHISKQVDAELHNRKWKKENQLCDILHCFSCNAPQAVCPKSVIFSLTCLLKQVIKMKCFLSTVSSARNLLALYWTYPLLTMNQSRLFSSSRDVSEMCGLFEDIVSPNLPKIQHVSPQADLLKQVWAPSQ